MNIIFFGTPDFSVPTLRALAGCPRHRVIAVVTQPDRPRDRGVVTASPVKLCAQELGIPVLQYNSIRKEGVEDLKKLSPDIGVTAAFGQILSAELLDIPRYGIVNVHASLLPKYRGSSPIQWSVINGETETGITVMQTAQGVDCGDILSVTKTPIAPDETAGELFDRLALLAPQILLDTLTKIEAGTVSKKKQDESAATHFPMLKKEDGRLDFCKPAADIVNLIRGVTPWPSAYTSVGGQALKVLRAAVLSAVSDAPCGTIVCADPSRGLVIAAHKGAVKLEIIQPSGKKAMRAEDWLRGHTVPTGIKTDGLC